jgi:predicted ester cyclase
MSVESNKQIVQRFIEEVYNQHLWLTVQELTTPGYLVHIPSGDSTHGVREIQEAFRSAFPDSHYTITQILGEGDLVAFQWTATGAHQKAIGHLAPEFALPATGQNVTVTGASLMRFEGDKIAEQWNHWDTHHLLKQIGSPQSV